MLQNAPLSFVPFYDSKWHLDSCIFASLNMCSAPLQAECLATPFTGDDKNLGEMVEEEAREAMKESQLKTQLRWENLRTDS